MREVADMFVAARLLVADRDPATREPTVEVAHEALLTRWSRLVDWVDEDRRWLTQLQHLSAAARAWDDGGRPDAELYRGSRLEAAIEALDIDGRVGVGPGARLRRGRSSRPGRRGSLRPPNGAPAAPTPGRRRRRARRRTRRRGGGRRAAPPGRRQRRRGRGAGRAGRDGGAEAQIEALVGRAESLRQTQRDTAALLAVEAYRLADTPRTRSALLATFTDRADVLRRPPPGGRRRRRRHRDARRRVGLPRRRHGAAAPLRARHGIARRPASGDRRHGRRHVRSSPHPPMAGGSPRRGDRTSTTARPPSACSTPRRDR